MDHPPSISIEEHDANGGLKAWCFHIGAVTLPDWRYSITPKDGIRGQDPKVMDNGASKKTVGA